MTDKEMVARLAQAMIGDTGEALRMFMGQKMAETVGLIAGCRGENAAFYAGILNGQQEIAQGLEGMIVTAQMMNE